MYNDSFFNKLYLTALQTDGSGVVVEAVVGVVTVVVEVVVVIVVVVLDGDEGDADVELVGPWVVISSSP